MKFRILLIIFIFLCFPSQGFSQEWKTHQGRHFIVYYKQAPQDFVKNVEQMAESYYDEISDNFRFTRDKAWSQDERAKIYIYNDANDYVKNAKQAHWSHGAASPHDKTIRTFPAAHGFFDSTLPHELGHIIFHECVGFKSNVPNWFEEGVAMYQEKAKRWGAHHAVKKALENKSFKSLAELSSTTLYSNSDPKLVEIFYAESASVVYFMISEFGNYRFFNLCHKLEEGMPFNKALEAAYGRFKNVDELNRAWVKYLKE